MLKRIDTHIGAETVNRTMRQTNIFFAQCEWDNMAYPNFNYWDDLDYGDRIDIVWNWFDRKKTKLKVA